MQPIPILGESRESAEMTDDTILEFKGLRTHFFSEEGTVRNMEGADLDIKRGRTMGIVDESGCGKTTIGRCIVSL